MEANLTLWRRVGSWIDIKGRREGWLGFILMRLTGIGLVVYLFLHLYMLRLLWVGPEAWNAFIELAHAPLFIFFDAVMIFGLIYHALNGIRVGILGLGFATDKQAPLFWGVFVLSFILTAASIAAIVAIG